MKKSFILAALLVLSASLAKADLRDIPKGGPQALASADYGGVDYSTVTFSSANVLLVGGIINKGNSGSISKVHVSSFPLGGIDSTYFIIRDTWNIIPGAVSGGQAASSDYTTTNEVYRVYLTTASGTKWVGSGTGFGFDYVFDPPLRVRKGATFKWSANSVPGTTIQSTEFNR